MAAWEYRIVAYYDGDIRAIMDLPNVCPNGHGMFDGEALIAECQKHGGFTSEVPDGYDELGYVNVWSGDDCPPFKCVVDGKNRLAYLHFSEQWRDQRTIHYVLDNLFLLEDPAFEEIAEEELPTTTAATPLPVRRREDTDAEDDLLF